MSNKHSPGPWSIEDGELQDKYGLPIGTILGVDDYPCFENVEDPDRVAAALEANAELIKQAPGQQAWIDDLIKQVSALTAIIEARDARIEELRQLFGKALRFDNNRPVVPGIIVQCFLTLMEHNRPADAQFWQSMLETDWSEPQ